MNPFDYLIVLISIVLGLAITNVLTRLATVITSRRVDFYWPPVAMAVWLFFICVQHWWAEWGVRHTIAWSFTAFLLQLLVPVVLYLASTLVLPEREEDGKLDLGAWYFHNRIWFFGLLALVPLLSVAEEIVRSGHMASTLNLVFLLAFVALAPVAIFLPSRRAQEWTCALIILMTIGYVATLYLSLPG